MTLTRRLIKLCGIFFIAASTVSAFAQPERDVHPPARDWPANSQLLLMIQRAAHTLNYQGVFTYHYGHSMRSSKITHVFDGKDAHERLESLDGKPREYLRFNDEVRELIPETQTILHRRRQGDLFPGLLLSDPKMIDQHYRIEIRPEPSRVAGRVCRVVDIVPKDALRFGYRLCADDETGLLLRARTVAEEARMIEQISFSQVTVNTPILESQLNTSWSIDTWQTIEPDETPVDLYALGWRISAPPGYVSTLQVSRRFAENKLVNQLILSDGLATISIFIEPYRADRSDYKPRGLARNGSVNIYGVQIGGFWLTVLGEVPGDALEQIVRSIQYKPSNAAR